MRPSLFNNILLLLLFIALGAVSANAQFVKAFTVKAEPSCKQTFYAFDAEDMDARNNVAYVDGCKLNVLDLKSGSPQYTLDLSRDGLDSAYSVYLYRNLTASDGKWTPIAAFRGADGMYAVFAIVSGKRVSLGSYRSAISPGIAIDGGTMYMVFNDQESITVYVARNDVRSILAIYGKSRYVTELGRMGLGGPHRPIFDATGAVSSGTSVKALFGNRGRIH